MKNTRSTRTIFIYLLIDSYHLWVWDEKALFVINGCFSSR